MSALEQIKDNARDVAAPRRRLRGLTVALPLAAVTALPGCAGGLGGSIFGGPIVAPDIELTDDDIAQYQEDLELAEKGIIHPDLIGNNCGNAGAIQQGYAGEGAGAALGAGVGGAAGAVLGGSGGAAAGVVVGGVIGNAAERTLDTEPDAVTLQKRCAREEHLRRKGYDVGTPSAAVHPWQHHTVVPRYNRYRTPRAVIDRRGQFCGANEYGVLVCRPY